MYVLDLKQFGNFFSISVYSRRTNIDNNLYTVDMANKYLCNIKVILNNYYNSVSKRK